MTLTEAQILQEWGPPCSGPSAVVTLHGGGRVTVQPALVDAVLAISDVLRSFGYATRAADTGGYACRKKVSGSGWSVHALKASIDINWRTNPYGKELVTDMPAEMVAAIKAIRTVSGAQVWTWGGDWRGNKDAMHFQIGCRRSDIATGIRPAQPDPTAEAWRALAAALARAKTQVLGANRENPLEAMAFLREGINRLQPGRVASRGPWAHDVALAVSDMQRFFGYNEFGLCGPKTWKLLYP